MIDDQPQPEPNHSPRSAFSRFEIGLFWLVLYTGTGLIIWNSLDYFLPNRMHSFLFERIELTMQDWWRYTLLTHTAGGVVCLISSLLQYSKFLLKRAPWMHRNLGRIYALSIITVVFPTGVALSFVAKGGLIGMIGFQVLAIATLLTLLLGLVAIYKRNIKSHQAWITRSFAMVTTAITFRILQVGLAQTEADPIAIYQACLWASILINLGIAEYYIIKIQKRSNKPNKLKLNQQKL